MTMPEQRERVDHRAGADRLAKLAEVRRLLGEARAVLDQAIAIVVARRKGTELVAVDRDALRRILEGDASEADRQMLWDALRRN